tara:strand:- start:1731 stop:3884 length:2154 start_codon:yes stop_codon:yes gene_type:complete
MANKFAGFTNESMEKKILPSLGYKGAMDRDSINKFLAATPSAAAMMGKYTMIARQMVEGKPVVNAFEGFNFKKGLEQAKKDTLMDLGKMEKDQDYYNRLPDRAARSQAAMKNIGKDLFGRDASPSSPVSVTPRPSGGPLVNMPNVPVGGAQSAGPDNAPSGGTAGQQGSFQTTGRMGMPSGANMTAQIAADPTAPTTVAAVQSKNNPNAIIAEGVGQAGDATQASVATTGAASQAATPVTTTASQMTPAQAQGAVDQALQGMSPTQGQVSPQSLMNAAQMDPNSAASLQLQAAQLGQAQTVQAPTPLQVTQDQLIDGSAVKQGQVDATLAKAEAALVQDEMADLMQDFQGGNTPVWAAGAMRAANAAMAARGLSASSMAGMAVVQAAMESALPIAQLDASNKQQMALMKAEQRAKFMGMEFDQNFQTKVKNAARISEIANINFSAEQTIALENARMAQTVDLANLSNRQAKIMADAATMTQIDMANLDNRQQAAVQNAQAFLQMDMANLDNAQQMTMFKAQETTNSILSDTAAMNAARQFNASSQNQTDQFFASLGSQVSRFNAEQNNAMQRFNAGETNALAQFNTAQDNAREQFNAQNHLLIAQANAQWAQNITTAENAAVNQANRDAAIAANNLTITGYNNAIQRERDLLAWAWEAGQNQKERDKAIAVATITATDGKQTGNKIADAAGNLLSKITNAAIDSFVPDFVDKINPFK